MTGEVSPRSAQVALAKAADDIGVQDLAKQLRATAPPKETTVLGPLDLPKWEDQLQEYLAGSKSFGLGLLVGSDRLRVDESVLYSVEFDLADVAVAVEAMNTNDIHNLFVTPENLFGMAIEFEYCPLLKVGQERQRHRQSVRAGCFGY